MKQRRCQHCHGTENLYINSRRIRSDGSEWLSFMCRPCGAERHRKYCSTPNGSLRQRIAVKKSTERNKEKQAARVAVRLAVVRGEIIKPDTCSICNIGKPEAHHDDYSKKLEVIWVCRQCHSDIHRWVIEMNK